RDGRGQERRSCGAANREGRVVRGGKFVAHEADAQLDSEQAQALLRRLWRMLRPYRAPIAGAVALLAFQTLCLLMGPLLVKRGIDKGLKAGNAGVLNQTALLYLGVALIALVLGRFAILVVARIGESFLRDLRVRVFDHLMKLGLDFFEREKTGRLVARMTSDVDAMQELVQMGLTAFVQNIMLFTGALIAIFLLSWQLALCTLVLVPP